MLLHRLIKGSNKQDILCAGTAQPALAGSKGAGCQRQFSFCAIPLPSRCCQPFLHHDVSASVVVGPRMASGTHHLFMPQASYKSSGLQLTERKSHWVAQCIPVAETERPLTLRLLQTALHIQPARVRGCSRAALLRARVPPAQRSDCPRCLPGGSCCPPAQPGPQPDRTAAGPAEPRSRLLCPQLPAVRPCRALTYSALAATQTMLFCSPDGESLLLAPCVLHG